MQKRPDKQADFKGLLKKASIFIIILSAIFLYKKEHIINYFSQDTIQKETQVLQEKIIVLEKEIKELTARPAPAAPQIVRDVQESQPTINLSGYSCDELDEKIQDYFNYLDEQDYLVSYNLKGGGQHHFTQLINELLVNPPIVERETDSLFTILTNTAHFYRVLDKENVLMIRDLIIREGDSLESALALFDQWAQNSSQCEAPQTAIRLPLPKLYEYAGFFLNTLGGQAYLFRRNPHVRLLIKYYCILVLDRANTNVLNRHGIDIIPPLKSLINEIEISETMTYKEQYLRTLRELQSKYQPYYKETADYTHNIILPSSSNV